MPAPVSRLQGLAVVALDPGQLDAAAQVHEVVRGGERLGSHGPILARSARDREDAKRKQRQAERRQAGDRDREAPGEGDLPGERARRRVHRVLAALRSVRRLREVDDLQQGRHRRRRGDGEAPEGRRLLPQQ